MKAIISKGLGPNIRLDIGERDIPTPGERDVLVKVHATSVNPKDWKLNLNLARMATPIGNRFMPPLYGDDLAGEVIDVGTQVDHVHIGDRIYGMDMRLRTASLAEYAVIDQRRIAPMLENTSFTEAAAAPLAAQTALQGLRKGHATRGSSVLIIGASGGVGTYAVQIARQLGCDVTGVCSTRNIELVESLGANHVIDYTSGDYRHSAGPFDLVFDVTSHETPSSCAAMRKPGGHFISTMGSGRAMASTLLARDQNAALIRVESHTQDLATIGEWLQAGQIRSIIDSRYPLAQTQQAYDRSRTGRARGKIVIDIVGNDQGRSTAELPR